VLKIIHLPSFSPVDDDDDNGPTFRGFSQRSGDSTPRDAGMKLRHQAIAFVSATPTEKKEDPIKEEDVVAALAEEDDEDDVMEDTMVDDADDSVLDNTIVTDTDVEIARDTNAMHIHERIEAPIAALDGAMDLPDAAPVPTSKPPTPPQEEVLSFVIDTEGDPTLSRSSKSKAKVPVRAASPTPSDSSEEVILFHGRNKPKILDDPVVSSRDTSSRHREAPSQKSTIQKTPAEASAQAPAKAPAPQTRPTNTHVTDDLLAALLGDENPTKAQGWAAKEPKWNKELQPASEQFKPAPPGSWWKGKGVPRPDLGPSSAEKEAPDSAAPRATNVAFDGAEESAGAGETIATLQAEWNDALRAKKRAKQTQQEVDDEFETVDEEDPTASSSKAADRAAAPDLGSRTSRRGKRGRKRSNKLLRDLQSDQTDEDEAAYNDYMENLRAQLELESGDDLQIPGIRSAEGGPSMVVDGQAIDEDDVLDRSTRNLNYDELRMMDTDSDSVDEEIGFDIDDISDDEDDAASDYDSSDLESDLAQEEKEAWEDEEDLRQRRIDSYDDETLARLWAKQGEMGIVGDELVIDDGAFMGEDVDGFGDLDEAKAGLQDLASSSFARSTVKRSNNKRGMSFPSASALADSVDQYGDAGFDIMDFERPSLRPKRGGRKGKMPPELEALSDDELKNEMLGHWGNDREKKRLKKAEREELRMQGLLGAGVAKKGKADLSQKYQQGITTTQIHLELRVFLQDVTKTTRAFPPMDKDDRKSLHEIANVLNLKSKSVGTGKNRAPVLYKTSRTHEYTDAMFNRITNAASKGFYKNSAFKGKKPKGGAIPKMQRGGKGRGADTSSTGLKHGDVVGGGAKEIGRENFGHRLMEKMGWQKGTALGKEGSGMLTPVEQVMRTGRSGLG